MQIVISPPKKLSKCLVLVGGSGDSSEKFLPLVTQINLQIPETNVCTFTFSSHSNTESILDIQARELEEVIEQLSAEYGFQSIDIFATSMGAYATIKLLASNQYSSLIRKVILFDPADYYVSAIFKDTEDVTWSGAEQYEPTQKVISQELTSITGNVQISVVHLTLRNYGARGYLEKDYVNRGKDESKGYPRLSTEMVKNFYTQITPSNRGKYLELSAVPHGFLRDGDIASNLFKVTDAIIKLI